MHDSILVWFFCIGILMFFLSLVFFLVSIKYRVNKGSNENFEEDREEAEAILADAKNLLIQLDEYSTNTIDNIDKRIEDMKAYFSKFEDYKLEFEKYKNEFDSYINSYQYNFEKVKTQQKLEANNVLNINPEAVINAEFMDDNLENKHERNIENHLHKKVIEFYESGMKQEDISKNLEIGRNEVKLIINRYIK
jgi:nitrogen fixation-related uncharacterized protein